MYSFLKKQALRNDRGGRGHYGAKRGKKKHRISRFKKHFLPLSDLRESGAIEQDADLVVLLMREEYYNPTEENKGLADVIIAKQRNGPVGTIKLAFIKEYMRFENLAHGD